ncbi:MAG: hypothetical protein AAF548_09020 [Actinomycetota bacterium]
MLVTDWGNAARAQRAALAVDHVEDDVEAGVAQGVDETFLDRFGLTRCVGRCGSERLAIESAGLDEVVGHEPQALLERHAQRDESVLAAFHEFLGLTLRRNEGGLLLLDDAEVGRTLEAGAVHDDDRVVVLGHGEAGLVARGLDIRTEQVGLDVAEVDLAAADAAALLVHIVGEDLEHQLRVADRDAEADLDGIFQAAADVADVDLVGADARVGVDAIGSGIVRQAEGVDLHERVVAAVERLLELVEDAIARVVEEVRLTGDRFVAVVDGFLSAVAVVGGLFPAVAVFGGLFSAVAVVGGRLLGLGVVAIGRLTATRGREEGERQQHCQQTPRTGLHRSPPGFRPSSADGAGAIVVVRCA